MIELPRMYRYLDKKLFKANVLVEEVRTVCIEAETKEEFRRKMDELGHIIVGPIIETSHSKETVVKL